MTPLQLTYPQRTCVRCQRHTSGQRLCDTCLADDERLTRAQTQALCWALNALSGGLGYSGTYQYKDSEEQAIDYAEELWLTLKGEA